MLRKILIVDDSDINRRLLRRILSEEYDILEAANGEEALAVLKSAYEELSAVLLDIVMPVMDGYAVLETMRADPTLAQIPVIVTTGSTDAEAELTALTLGANDFITKPYIPAIIKRRLQNTINLRETAAAINALQRDRLTGLYNREAFFQKAAELIRAHPAGYYMMCCFDIDNFKVINDQYGSEKGDAVLQHVARVFQAGFRAVGGITCRITADNFAVLYPMSFLHSAELVKMREAASVLDGSIPPISFSIGRYVVDDLSLSVSAMYDRAALAAASVKGRYDVNIMQYDESMREHLLQEQEIVNEMKQALLEHQFEVWLQPQYNHASGALIGAEALVRWQHPVRGLVMPGDFIPVFERNGFIYEMDKYVWEQSCILLRQWIDEGGSPLPLSVNVSRYDVFREDLIGIITGLVEKYGIPMELLRLEITESAFAKSTDQIIRVVKELIDLGFTVEIDDFGSGYSSLNTLKDVPAQIVKLDMRFLESNSHSDRGGNILESVVRMAKWLDMSVIAEGVETAAQADYLKSIGCNYVQGYLYARPMPAADYQALVRDAATEPRLSTLETVENLNNNAFWDPESMDTLIFNSYVGGACIFEYHNGNIELLRATDKYAQLIGSAGMTIEEALRLDWVSHLDEPSRAEVKDAIERSIRTRDEVTSEYVFLDLPGCPEKTYLRSTLRVIAATGDRYLVYCTNESMTAQREAEQKERESLQRIRSLNENLQNMMNDTPGGFTRLRVNPDGSLAAEYFNETFCNLRGMSYDEVMAADGADATHTIHPDDRELVRAAAAEMAATGEPCNIQYRLLRADGTYIPVNVFCRMTRNEDGESFINGYFTNLNEKEKREFTLRETMPYVLSAIMEYSTDLMFAKDREFRYICCSPAFVKFTRQKTQADVIGKNDYDFWTKEEADHFRGDDMRLFELGEPLLDYIEPIPSDDGIQHYCSTSKYILYDSTGEVIGMYGIGRDITEYRTSFEQLRLLTDSIPGGIATYAVSPQGVKLRYFNDGFCRALGATREEYEKLSGEDPTGRVFAEDLPLIREQVMRLIRDDTPINCTFRIRPIHGEGYKWVDFRGVTSGRAGDTVFINAVQFDVTEVKQAQEAAIIHEQEMRLAMSQMGKMLCEYDPATHTLSVPESFAALYGMPSVIPDVPESLVRAGAITEDTLPAYRAFYDAILRGEKTGSAEYCDQRTDGSLHWERAEFSTLFDSDGQPVKALIAVEDTTQMHLQYELEQSRPSLGEENLIVHALFNLTTGETLNYLYRDGSEVPLEDRTALTYGAARVDELFIDPGERAQYRALNDPAALLERYARGESELSLDYRRRTPDGNIIWTRNIMRMVQQPGGSDVLLFDYFYNIEEEKTLQLMYATLVNENYDYVARINVRTRHFAVMVSAALPDGAFPEKGMDADEVARTAVDVHPDDWEMVLRNTLVEGIKRNLEDSGRFTFTFRMLPDGSLRYKRVTQYYLDRERDIIIMTREDITALMQEEMHKNELLEQARQAAREREAADNLRMSEEQLRIAVSIAGWKMARYDIKNRVYYHEEEALLAMGFDKKVENVPQAFVDAGAIAPEFVPAYLEFFDKIRRGEASCSLDSMLLMEDGNYHWCRQDATVIFDAEGKPSQAIIVRSDITELREKEAVYKKWQQSLQQRPPETYTLIRCNLSKNASQYSTEGSLLHAEYTPGATFEERTQEYVRQSVFAEDQKEYLAFLNLDTLLANYYRGIRTKTLEYRETLPGDAQRWLRLSVEMVEYPNSTDIEAYLMYEDIDESKREELRNKERAETDPLTGVLNRTAFSQAVEGMAASGETEPFALLMLDIDGFKRINDTFGHAMGDQVLINIANSLRGVLRRGDMLGRLGGDEFLICLKDMSEEGAIAKKAEQICTLLHNTLRDGVYISTSIGIAIYPRDGRDFETLYQKMDAALYTVKGRGKNDYAFFREGMHSVYAQPGQPED